MDNIFYSKMAIEDLQRLKMDLIDRGESLRAIQNLSKIVDDIFVFWESQEEGYSLEIVEDSDVKYFISQQHLIFYRVLEENLMIDRILNEELDYIKILFD